MPSLATAWPVFCGLLALLAGCAGSRDTGCADGPGCGIPCCGAETLCQEGVCDGVAWICRKGADGSYAWVRDGAPCAPDMGPDMLMLDSGPVTCGDNAVKTPSGCSCEQGYLNTDGSWDNGCESPDPACSVAKCGHCPEGFCGQNAHCLDNSKCRCIDKYWMNKDKDWSNGCEHRTETCSPTNCNQCYTGFCNGHADCMQNNCKCVVSGWTNCDGVWELNGCECNGTCVNGQCS